MFACFARKKSRIQLNKLQIKLNNISAINYLAQYFYFNLF